jgi:hypothetical protein
MAELRYRGRKIREGDILYIRTPIEQYLKESRRRLSVRVCEAWQWRQSNGALRDMVCRGMLLMLERAGQIALPPVTYVRHNPLAHRARPEAVPIDKSPIEDPLHKLQPLEFEQVRRSAQEPLFNSLMEEHHHLGYEQPVGEHLKYLVWSQGRPIACLAWSSAPRHIGSRDRYIGWDAAARRSNIRFIAYNTRFLILPWVRVEHLCRISWAGWRRGYATTGSGCTVVRFTSWKHSWIRNGFAEHVTRRLTGCYLDGPPEAASNRPVISRTGRSRRFSGYR